jgi:hypothetical protein
MLTTVYKKVAIFSDVKSSILAQIYSLHGVTFQNTAPYHISYVNIKRRDYIANTIVEIKNIFCWIHICGFVERSKVALVTLQK